MPAKGFSSVKIETEVYAEMKSLCDETGHKLGFHLERALRNYLTDEAPVWRTAARETHSKLRKLSS